MEKSFLLHTSNSIFHLLIIRKAFKALLDWPHFSEMSLLYIQFMVAPMLEFGFGMIEIDTV